MKRHFFHRLAAAAAIAAAGMAPGFASAETIFLGIDTQGPVQMHSTAGVFLGDFGQTGATGSALDGAGSVWTVAPAFGNNKIQKYDAAQTVLNTFTATVGGQWIEDMAYGGKVAGVDTLWVGTFEGDVQRIDANTGAVLSSFSPGLGQFLGVAYDGTDLWLTGGAFEGNSKISRYSDTGSFLGAFDTGRSSAGGIGYSAATKTLWVGYFGPVYQYSLTGTELSTFVSGSAFHDGLEIGDVSAVPEPQSMALLLAGLAVIGGTVARRRKT